MTMKPVIAEKIAENIADSVMKLGELENRRAALRQLLNYRKVSNDDYEKENKELLENIEVETGQLKEVALELAIGFVGAVFSIAESLEDIAKEVAK
jgi:hypothetical protein